MLETVLTFVVIITSVLLWNSKDVIGIIDAIRGKRK